MKPARILITAALLFFTCLSYAQDATALYEEGLQLKKDKKVSEAVEKFKQAIALKPGYTEATYECGWCMNDMKNYADAIDYLRKARVGWSVIPKVHFELGYAFEKTNSIDSAISCYKRCLELKPDYSLAFKQLGYIAYLKEQYPSALDYFRNYEAASKLEITDYLYWYRKGFIDNALKDYEAAKTALKRSLQYKQDYFNTYLELGFASKMKAEDDEAISNYKKAMDLDPKSHIPYNGIGEVYRDNKRDMSEAMVWYRKTLQINPRERKANFGVGYCLSSTGKYEEAVSYLKTAVAEEPTYTAAYVELGYCYYKLEKYPDAIASCNKAISLSPKNENARYYAGLVYIIQKNKVLAQKMADELKGLLSKNAGDLQARIDAM